MVSEMKIILKWYIVVLSGTNEVSLKEKNIKHLKLDKFNYKLVKKAIENFKPDIVHAHDIKASIMATITCKKNIKVISHIHSNHKNMRKISLKSVLFNYVSKRISKIIWVSQSAFDNYVYKDRIKEKSIVLYNVINKKELVDSIQRDKNQYGTFDIIYLGRLIHVKNPERLINIIKSIKKNGYNIKVAIVGDGDLYNSVEKLIDMFELKDNVKLFGYVTNPYKILNSSKILMMTSRYEGTPMVVLEAMALGKPIISTPVDGIKDLVAQEINGFLSNDDRELERVIMQLLKDDKILEEYSKNALKQFEKISNINKYILEIKKIYE